MELNELFSVIANVGFPIAVSVYLLVRIETRLDTLSKAIQELASAVNHIK